MNHVILAELDQSTDQHGRVRPGALKTMYGPVGECPQGVLLDLQPPGIVSCKEKS